jgi:hypothetical protein
MVVIILCRDALVVAAHGNSARDVRCFFKTFQSPLSGSGGVGASLGKAGLAGFLAGFGMVVSFEDMIIGVVHGSAVLSVTRFSFLL